MPIPEEPECQPESMAGNYIGQVRLTGNHQMPSSPSNGIIQIFALCGKTFLDETAGLISGLDRLSATTGY